MVRENILNIKESIRQACFKINCDPNSIIIVAVSKGRTIQQIREAIEAGITDIGENRVQEAVLKYNDMRYAISDKQIKWHMVGHLQTNKVKDAARIFDLIQSVDSLRLAEEINKQARQINKIQEILVEVKTSPEAAKSGVLEQEAAGLIKTILELKNIRVRGLMTIAPMVDNPEKTRSYFRKLRELKEQINALSTIDYRLSTLSMGMTDDFEAAIEEGSNMIRLGRAIFEG